MNGFNIVGYLLYMYLAFVICTAPVIRRETVLKTYVATVKNFRWPFWCIVVVAILLVSVG